MRSINGKCPKKKGGKKAAIKVIYEHRKIATTSKSIVKGLLVHKFVAPELGCELRVVAFCMAAWVVGVAARLDVTMLLAEVEETAETMGS